MAGWLTKSRRGEEGRADGLGGGRIEEEELHDGGGGRSTVAGDIAEGEGDGLEYMSD